MPRSSRHVAAILALMFVEFGQSRMRVSEKTLRVAGKRKALRDVHKAEVRAFLEDYFELAFLECETGFVLMRLGSLSSTRSMTFAAFRRSTDSGWVTEEDAWDAAEQAFAETEEGEGDD